MNEIHETLEDLAVAIASLYITYDIDTSEGIGKQVLSLFTELCSRIKEIK